ncbi:putative zinc finger protein [Lojkania enalia]|uniref:Zinc finger protein n=1 Tax=Lojkania enalia TaxID=147567 RepID=A0A9P4KIX7_9PLEO|nr:putative zinc finger protein [Didymosphaeria enalia]
MNMSVTSPNPEAAPFERALAQFKMGLKRRDQENFRKTTLADLRQCIGDLQDKQHASRRLKGLTRIQPFLEAMEQFGKVVTIFANTNDIVAFIWTSSAYVDAFKELLDAYQHIGENIPLLIQYEELFRSNSDMLGTLALMYEDVLKFHHDALTYFQKPLWIQMFDATWKTYKSRFSGTISNLARHRQLLESNVTLAQIKEFQQSRVLENARFETQTKNEELHQLRTVFDWLRPAKVESDQDEFVKIRTAYSGIGKWILDDPTFQEWFDPLFPMIPPLLWLNGIPGAGKTILASLVVEEAQKLKPTPTVLYFYCNHKNPERDNFRAVTRTILAQLLKQDKDLLAYFYGKCCESGETVLESRSTIETLLKTGLDNCKSAYIVIDGLDECGRDERKEITQWFRKLVEDLPTTEPERLRCLFVSQDDGFGRKDFSGLASIKIKPENNKPDIECYCRIEAEKLTLHPFYLAHERAVAIANTVSNSTEGMFLLAKLVWMNIFGQTSIAGLEEELEPDVFPTEINAAYERIMQRIKDQASPTRWKEVVMVLGWLVCAKRPLQWHEIQTLKAMNMDNESIDYDRQRFVVAPMDLFDSLVERRDDGTVQLVHLSAKYFLVDQNKIDLPAEELKMATRCIDYLNLPTLASPTEIDVRNGDFGLLDYAVLYWIRHFEAGIIQAGDGHDDLMTAIAESLDIFIQKHWRDPNHPLVVSQRNRDKLQFFHDLSFYDKLEQAVVSTRKHITFFGEIKKEEIALDLSDVVASVRKNVEDFHSSVEGQSSIEDMKEKYGDNVFKCPRFSCQFFTTGFPNDHERGRHVDKHIRPFRCTEEACAGFIFGFMSTSDLNKHMRETHSRVSIEDEQFPTEKDIQGSMQVEQSPEEPTPTPVVENVEPEQAPIFHPLPAQQRTRRKERQKIFQCNHCGKVYAKRYNWKSHLLTHATDKPFKCTFCDVSFARLSDTRRHEGTHVKKTHVCQGCGKAFARADVLSNHRKSKAGQRCIRPPIPEREIEQTGISN